MRETSSLTKDLILHSRDSLLKVCVHGRARRQHTSSRADVGEIGMAQAGTPGRTTRTEPVRATSNLLSLVRVDSVHVRLDLCLLFVCSLDISSNGSVLLLTYMIPILWPAEMHTRWQPLIKATIKGPRAPPSSLESHIYRT